MQVQAPVATARGVIDYFLLEPMVGSRAEDKPRGPTPWLEGFRLAVVPPSDAPLAGAIRHRSTGAVSRSRFRLLHRFRRLAGFS